MITGRFQLLGRILRRQVLLAAALSVCASGALSEPYIRDDPADTGLEPNPSSGPMWTSPDIWVRTSPMPGWNPAPYPSGSPPVWLDTTHSNPDYRSPLSGSPNYIYIRVRNRGAASTGAERLQVYWASASTGLAWDPAKVGGSFIDNKQGGVLFGMEITKVRKNAASATQAERDAYLAALRKIAVDPAFKIANGQSYWTLQQEVHRFGPMYRHGINGGSTWIPSVAFLPWHRELINRFEGLLQEADPTVKLLYWEWTQNPVSGPLNYSTAFMGAYGTGSPPSAVPVGAPISPDTDPAYPNAINGLSVVTRRLQGAGTPLAQSNAIILGRGPYDDVNRNSAFSGGLESLSHNSSHVYIASTPTGGNQATVGDQLFQPYAARDPFFFFLHTKVDELWARWQRKSLANLDPATTFGTAGGDANIASTMGPWDGTTAQGDNLPNNIAMGAQLDPWSAAGGQIYAKPGNDRSVTSPPFYDTSPLTIPAMQPGEEVIIEIPWYPPSPSSFGNIADPAHVCIIARIETNASTPFGMTTPETNDINFNTRQNNKIAWRNVSIVDSFPGPFKLMKFLIANNFTRPVLAGLRFGAIFDERGGGFFDRGSILVNVGRELAERWKRSGGRATGIEPTGDGLFRITRPDAALAGIPLKPGEMLPVRLTFELKKDYRPTKPGETILFDVVQTGLPGDDKGVVGGQRYQVALDRLKPLERGRVWRWLPAGRAESPAWRTADFQDQRWHERKLDLGWVEPDAMGGMMRPEIAAGPVAGHARVAPTYLFRRAFAVEDPDFYRNLALLVKGSDGGIVYLNGKEVYRFNMPDGPISDETPARRALRPIEKDAYFPVRLSPALLRRGTNVIAAEVHRAAGDFGPLTFDAEMTANEVSAAQAPVARFANVADGALLRAGAVAEIDVDALKPDGAVRSATLFVNGQAVQTLGAAPFRFRWPVRPGANRMSVSVTGDDGLTSRTYAAVNGVANVPPRVSLAAPRDQIEVAAGDTVTAVAQASDPDGRIAHVDFYVQESYIIGAQARFVGSVTRPPYAVRIGDLKSDHAMIVAVAYDNEGGRTASTPVMLMVKRPPSR
jgi:hypothetical protein